MAIDYAKLAAEHGGTAVRQPSPGQIRRRQEIEAARARYDAEAAGLESQAMRELLAAGGGAAASLLIPGGGGMLARGALGALGGAAGAGTEAAIMGDDILPAAGRGALYGGLLGPLGAKAGQMAGEARQALGSAASRAMGSDTMRRAGAVASEIGKDIPLVKGALKGVQRAKRIGAAGATKAPGISGEAKKLAALAAAEPDPRKAAQLMRLARRTHKVMSGEAPTAGSAASRVPAAEAAPAGEKVAGKITPAEGVQTKAKPTQKEVNEAFGFGGKDAENEAQAEVFDKALIRRGGKRHDIQFASASKGNIDIESMPISHIRNAINQRAAKIGQTKKYTPMARAELQALKDEVTYRMKEAAKVGMEYRVPEELPRVSRR